MCFLVACPMRCSYGAILSKHDLIGTFNAHSQLSFSRLLTSKTLKALASTIASINVLSIVLYHNEDFLNIMSIPPPITGLQGGDRTHASRGLKPLPLPTGLPGDLVGKVGLEPTVYLRSRV